VRQWELSDGGSTVRAVEVRSFRVPGFKPNGDQITEACTADDQLGALYVAEEDAAIWRYGAEPDDATPPVAVDVTGPSGHLVADVEGLAIYSAPGGAGYLLASSQGSEELVVYERSVPNRYVERFGIGIGAVDRVSDSDGLEVAAFGLGREFPDGLLVVHDGYNALPEGGDRQNFKLVPWGAIARGLAIPLLIDPRLDPRVATEAP
jgi:3-phytase